MFDIKADTHLHCKTKHLINICVKYFRSVDSSLKKKHIKSFVKDIITNYFSWNNFHNFKHAFEVFQMVWYLQQFNKDLNKEDRKLLLITALCHDLNHIGSSNTQIKNTNSFEDLLSCDNENSHHGSLSKSSTRKMSRKLSDKDQDIIIASFEAKQKADVVYNETINNRTDSYDSNFKISNDDSFNEKVHIRQTTVLMSKHMKHLLKVKTLSDIELVNKKINSMILATDLKLQKKYLNIIDTQHHCNPLAQMILILKLADVSHPFRPFSIHCYWVFKLVEETNEILNESLSYIAKDTISFVSNFGKPMLLKFIEIYKVPQSNMLLKNLNDNINVWNSYVGK